MAVRDGACGQMGTARRFFLADWGPDKLTISSLLLRGDLSDPLESNLVRRFKPGKTFTYIYDLFNLAKDAGKRSAVEVRTEIWRGGTLLFAGTPIPLQFSPEPKADRRSAS